MKKQFFRVKQLADQTFSRAGKTEVLTDDLQAADKHVDQIKAALTGLSKRLYITPSQSGTLDPAYKEKRLRKCPEFVLGQTMLDNASEDGLMSFALSECGRAQVALANENVEHESKVEQYVAAPLQHILETDVPNIMKQKRNLQRLILDMDSIRARYHQASKHNVGGTGATKVDSLRDELEEAESKVDQCRDQLAAEMFQLMSKETELAQTIIQYVKLQRAYHESALHCLEELIPGLECFINDNEMKPVYGYSLEEHLRVTNRKIALPIQLSVSTLLRLGMEEEGLFRIASGASKLRRIKLSFDACCLTLPIALEYKDPHAFAGALKSYLRELPEPLLTFKLYSEWMAAAKITQSDARLRALWEVLHKLPTVNFENLRFLIKFLAVLAKNQDINKMTPHNIAIVIAPNLIWSQHEDTTTMVMDMSTANNSSLIVDQLITYVDWFFPGEIDFDRDLDLGMVNGSEHHGVGLRRCISNSSLSDHGESPPQGSPKPATRRKNKPAPTPPNSTTPDKHDKHEKHDRHEKLEKMEKHDKRPDDKPPPAPDKPPRPLTTSTINRVTYKAHKQEVNAEVVNAEHEKLQDKPNQVKTVENDTKSVVKIPEISGVPLKTAEATECVKTEDGVIENNHSEVVTKVNDHTDISQEAKNNVFIGFEALNLKPGDTPQKSIESEHMETPIKPKPTVSDKPTPVTLERRKLPVAAPRSITNICTSQPVIQPTSQTTSQPSSQPPEEIVELRKKPETNNIHTERNSKPAIPERPAGLVRPSSLIRPHPRQSNENLDEESGPLTLERTHMYSVDKQQVSIVQVRNNNAVPVVTVASNGNPIPNLQRSPSVGSRPTSMSISGDRPEKPPRPDLPEQAKAHTRTRSEGNIIDVQTKDSAIISKPSILNQQPPPASPRFLQHRPPRPQPPPPPPPNIRPKSEQESTNL